MGAARGSRDKYEVWLKPSKFLCFLPELSCRAFLNEVLIIKEVIKVRRKGR